MKLDRIVLVLAGLGGIAAFFLPFFHFKASVLGLNVADFNMSGFDYVAALLNNFDVISYPEGKKILRFVGELWSNTSDGQDLALMIGFLLILSGPIYFLTYSLGYVIQGIRGKQYQKGIFFTIIYVGVAWLVFYLMGQQNSGQLFGLETGIPFNFFKMAGIGCWVAIGSMLAAAFSLFFAKKLD